MCAGNQVGELHVGLVPSSKEMMNPDHLTCSFVWIAGDSADHPESEDKFGMLLL